MLYCRHIKVLYLLGVCGCNLLFDTSQCLTLFVLNTGEKMNRKGERGRDGGKEGGGEEGGREEGGREEGGREEEGREEGGREEGGEGERREGKRKERERGRREREDGE